MRWNLTQLHNFLVMQYEFEFRQMIAQKYEVSPRRRREGRQSQTPSAYRTQYLSLQFYEVIH